MGAVLSQVNEAGEDHPMSVVANCAVLLRANTLLQRGNVVR